MLKYKLTVFIVLLFFITIVLVSFVTGFNLSGPKYQPTNGEAWPKPQRENKSNEYFIFKTSQFHVKILSHTCDILVSALQRYNLVLSQYTQIQVSNRAPSKSIRQMNDISLNKGYLKELHIVLSSKCEVYPHYDMDEHYKLTVKSTSVLWSNSIWGILRGLQTFSQLFYFSQNYSEIRINATQIVDYPQYKHRGLLIDTGRHFLRLQTIQKMLDAMEMNKMNVLHWHIVDDQSFPYQSKQFPSLSLKGAFAPSMVYTRNDIISIIEYARVRGIRIIPEFDVPGHTRSWGNTFPNLLTKCYDHSEVTGLGPLNPINNVTYGFLQLLYQEINALFPDQFLHVGGDEVDTKCWESNPDIIKFVKKNHLTIDQLHALFIGRTLSLLRQRIVPIVWQEVFDNHALDKPTHVQVWKYQWISEIIEILKGGHYVIFSSTWYLDYLKDGWDKFYLYDPRQMVYDFTENETLLLNIVGGEACMWGEMVDDTNVLSRTWPRTSAVAERLWTGLDYKNGFMDNYYSLELARHRIEEHTCRMNRNGIPAEPPNGPGFCVGSSY